MPPSDHKGSLWNLFSESSLWISLLGLFLKQDSELQTLKVSIELSMQTECSPLLSIRNCSPLHNAS